MLNALVQTTNDNFRLLANQMSGIRNLMAILQVQPQNGIPSHNAMTLGGIANKKKDKIHGIHQPHVGGNGGGPKLLNQNQNAYVFCKGFETMQ